MGLSHASIARYAAGRGAVKPDQLRMNLRELIPVDVTASAVAHLSVLALVLLLSEVHPFDVVAADTVPVDIVTPQDMEKKTEPTPLPSPSPSPPIDLSALQQPAESTPPAPAPPPAAPAPSPQHKQPAPAESSPAQPQATAKAASTPAYTPPEPDLSVKYNVQLGLPPSLPVKTAPAPTPAPRYGGRVDDDFDAPAVRAADIAPSVVTEFRRHLKTCSKLPASLKPSDDVKVTLRVFLTPEGRLADEPLLIEASASEKGPVLMRGAMSALEACQPYTMLPADRYGEWKVLDLSFTPQDFAS
jgi:outer membrane biosynthesis protein TonB